MTQSATGQFENDKTSPKTDIIEKIASALGVSPSELMKDNFIWEEFDKQYPNVGREYACEQAVKSYLTVIGYSVNEQVVNMLTWTAGGRALIRSESCGKG